MLTSRFVRYQKPYHSSTISIATVHGTLYSAPSLHSIEKSQHLQQINLHWRINISSPLLEFGELYRQQLTVKRLKLFLIGTVLKNLVAVAMGWTSSQKSSASFTNFRICSSLSSSRGETETSKGGCLSHTLCPLLYHSVSSSGKSGGEKEKGVVATDSDLPPEYYKKVLFHVYFQFNSKCAIIMSAMCVRV